MNKSPCSYGEKRKAQKPVEKFRFDDIPMRVKAPRYLRKGDIEQPKGPTSVPITATQDPLKETKTQEKYKEDVVNIEAKCKIPKPPVSVPKPNAKPIPKVPKVKHTMPLSAKGRQSKKLDTATVIKEDIKTMPHYDYAVQHLAPLFAQAINLLSVDQPLDPVKYLEAHFEDESCRIYPPETRQEILQKFCLRKGCTYEVEKVEPKFKEKSTQVEQDYVGEIYLTQLFPVSVCSKSMQTDVAPPTPPNVSDEETPADAVISEMMRTSKRAERQSRPPKKIQKIVQTEPAKVFNGIHKQTQTMEQQRCLLDEITSKLRDPCLRIYCRSKT